MAHGLRGLWPGSLPSRTFASKGIFFLAPRPTSLAHYFIHREHHRQASQRRYSTSNLRKANLSVHINRLFYGATRRRFMISNVITSLASKQPTYTRTHRHTQKPLTTSAYLQKQGTSPPLGTCMLYSPPSRWSTLLLRRCHICANYRPSYGAEQSA